MVQNTPDIGRILDLVMSKKEKYDPGAARIRQWRIENEYPEDLYELMCAWAKGEELPNVEYNGVSLQRIMNNTSFRFPDAVDLLYVLYKDPAAGYEIFMRSVKRDK